MYVCVSVVGAKQMLRSMFKTCFCFEHVTIMKKEERWCTTVTRCCSLHSSTKDWFCVVTFSSYSFVPMD